jgi:hypothetical protein
MSDSALWKYTYPLPAMTMRQWYAGQALAGYMAQIDSRTCPKNEDLEQWRAKVLRNDAEFMFRMADAMIEAEAQDAGN